MSNIASSHGIPVPFSRYSGAASSTNRFDFEGISFIENTAFIDGGAVLITTPDNCFVSDVAFTANEAMFGGAVSLTSSALSSVEFQFCRFESNDALSGGGAIYSYGNGWSFIRGSLFNQNNAGENAPKIFLTACFIRVSADVPIIWITCFSTGESPPTCFGDTYMPN